MRPGFRPASVARPLCHFGRRKSLPRSKEGTPKKHPTFKPPTCFCNLRASLTEIGCHISDFHPEPRNLSGKRSLRSPDQPLISKIRTIRRHRPCLRCRGDSRHFSPKRTAPPRKSRHLRPGVMNYFPLRCVANACSNSNRRREFGWSFRHISISGWALIQLALLAKYSPFR